MTDYGNASTVCTRASDAEMHKPPIGVKPGWLCATQRISELASAIQRYAEDEHGVARRSQMRLWAEEMVLQVQILEWLKQGEKDGQS